MDRVRGMLGCDSPAVLPYTGKDVCVGVLDSGVALHPDLRGRIAAFRDFTDRRRTGAGHSCYDDNGHGTHVCGILAGNGMASKGKYRGIAPECVLICGKVLDNKGGGSLKNLLRGLEWMLEIHQNIPVKIVNISIEMDSEENLNKEEIALLKKYFKRLWFQGVMIVAAAGNKGPNPMTLSPLGECGYCMCVGCHDGSYAGVNGKTCSAYSGRGPGKKSGSELFWEETQGAPANPLKKPDLVAPGTDIISCSHRYNIKPYIAKSGTSMSAPIVSGACALCLHKYPWISNVQLRRMILATAKDMGETWSVQGAGMLQIDRMLTQKTV